MLLAKPSERTNPEFWDRTVSDAEKYAYTDSKRVSFALIGLVSAIPLLFGLWMFASHESLILCMLPLVIVNGIYLLLSYGVMLSGSSFSLRLHQGRLSQFWSRPMAERAVGVSVDIFLPVCGEDRSVVLETWDGVRRLNWPGRVEVYVLDDSPDDGFRLDAARYGFHYLRRQGHEFKKAGNLQHGFLNSSGDFILLLDADFRPRTDMLTELVPYLLEGSQLAIVQSPQYFDVHSQMGWVQAGAGYVQELFYRLIQPARDRWDAAVCVGSCAVYRREALGEAGGFAQIGHSEDIWTGFELMKRGWRIRYLPIILAKGECPKTVASFFTQQYRWCSGSMTLVTKSLFWRSPLTSAQKLCYFSGLAYYLATAVNVFFAPAPPLAMVWFFPELVRWYHLAFWILALAYATLIMALWSRHPFGFHFLSTREISAAAHLMAVVDGLRGQLMSWIPTGSRGRCRDPRTTVALYILLTCSGLAATVTWSCATRHVLHTPAKLIDFAPPAFFVAMHACLCWRAITCPTAQSALVGEKAAKAGRNVIGNAAAYLRPLARRPGVRFACALVLLALIIGGTGSTTNVFGIRDRLGTKANATPAPSSPLKLIGPPTVRLGPSFWTSTNVPVSPFADFGPWTVENAFPTSDPLWGAMRIRQHPQDLARYYVGSYEGTISEVIRVNGRWSVTPIVKLQDASEGFLFSFVLHPQFERLQRLFVFYRTAENAFDQYYRVSSIDVPGDNSQEDVQEKILIEQKITSTEHVGGDLAFDSDGFLLISVGDNAKSHQDVNSQRIDQGLFSGILRVDVDCRGGNVSHAPRRQPLFARVNGYFIPNDNPFVGEPNALEEFWAIGLRNPFRLYYDHAIDRLWVGEVGQDRLEQIELASTGTNHLWSFREGTLPYSDSYLNGNVPDPLFGRPVDPFYEYRHMDQNYCVVGGAVYRGEKFSELQGKYLFGDNQSGRVWALDPERPQRTTLLLQLPFTKKGASLVSISSDRSGDVFFTNYASWPPVYKLRRAEHLQPPERLSQTGLFSDLHSLTPSEGLTPYEVNVPLWSDGMHKRRWIRLPPGEQIGNVDDQGPLWKFPPGTVFVKHFEYPRDSHAHAGRNLETRVLIVKEDGQVMGCSYLWLEDQSDALVQLERTVLPLPTPGKNGGGFTTFDYHLPGPRDCLVCHNRENPVLGVNLLQLNRTVSESASTKNQLVAMSHQGLFAQPFGNKEAELQPTLSCKAPKGTGKGYWVG